MDPLKIMILLLGLEVPILLKVNINERIRHNISILQQFSLD